MRHRLALPVSGGHQDHQPADLPDRELHQLAGQEVQMRCPYPLAGADLPVSREHLRHGRGADEVQALRDGALLLGRPLDRGGHRIGAMSTAAFRASPSSNSLAPRSPEIRAKITWRTSWTLPASP